MIFKVKCQILLKRQGYMYINLAKRKQISVVNLHFVFLRGGADSLFTEDAVELILVDCFLSANFGVPELDGFSSSSESSECFLLFCDYKKQINELRYLYIS